MHTLRAERLSKTYDGRFVINDVSLSVDSGEIVGLLGPNGAGKTTMFYMMVGMLRPEKGSILLDGEDISRMPMYQRARRGISYLPQEPSIFRRLSVRDNLRAVLEIAGLPSGEIEERIGHILDEFRLREFADRESLRLSGGERRRAEIARSIALEPKFILFDEPFSGIDPIAIIELKKMLKYLKDKGLGILITDHNVRDTLSITDRAYILAHGQLLDEGPPEKLVASTRAKDIYLGKEFKL
ncbi:MAG: LPS export ABC transporter ATP-binding protein [Thermodesulfovibrionales bacterium]|nr:LPS export ABC transporter ATP-binding protein [Thermodesulfovibrionales bacterium]